ncbi:extracellular matrix regulator RemB [Pseudoneobacillus sp. C159]
MFVHIGEETMIRAVDIVAILDKDSVEESEYFQEYLRVNEKKTENLSKKPFKSIVITNQKIFYSPIASTTLKKRSYSFT